MSAEAEDIAFLKLLPHTLSYVPIDSRRADAKTLRQIAVAQRLKRGGYLTAQIVVRAPGYYDLVCLLTQAGADHVRWAA